MSTVTITLEVPEEWINEMVLNVDVFRTNVCGYWAYGVEHDEDLGWLIWEDLDKPQALGQHDAAIYAWRKGIDLPACYYRFDRQLAIDAFGWFVRLYGESPDNADATALDRAIQHALWGEERYG